ncbi:hypothetical protein [Paenibacillus maysiensis]|uniref:hypothetical protein n=1 Tax=Paenibacillus maysiensis TaxID=1155954 RepID=UPI000470D2C8|nr:hypothetical protein [Paenibacillus maysiensis]
MKYFKQRLSKVDIQALSKEQVKAISGSIYLNDPEQGDIIYDVQTDTLHTVISTEGKDGSYAVVTPNGELDWNESFIPLFTVGQLLDALYLEDSVEIKSSPRGGWVVILDDSVFQTKDNDALVNILLDALLLKVSRENGC